MKSKFLFLGIVLMTLINCKNNNSDLSTENKKEQDLSNRLKITVSLIAKTDDNFCMLYTDNGTINFGDKAVWTSLKGSDTPQNLVFLFPKDEFPTLFRLDLGHSNEQKDILMKEVKFEFQKNIRVLKGIEIGAFFRGDSSNCDYDYKTGIVKPKMLNGKRLSPTLYPHENIQLAEIPKIYK